MARDHARIDLSIWSDDDWRGLTPAAQHLYFVLLTHRTLNYAGVADWRPARIRPSSNGWGRQEFDRAAHELAERLYIVVDEETEEVLIRSFVRHDGLMKQRNMAVAMARSYEGIASSAIRGVFIHELHRLRESDPKLGGWKACDHLLGNPSVDPSEYPTGYPSVDPSGNPSNDPSRKGESSPSVDPCPTPYSLLPTPSSLLPAPAETASRPDEFDSFWAIYPRRQGKGEARKAFAKARKKVALGSIIDGATRFRDDPNREDEFTPHATTWLNQERWDDDPLPTPGTGLATTHQLPKRATASDRARSHLDTVAEAERLMGGFQ